MNILQITKALSNPTRANIVSWLKDPKTHFPAACEDNLVMGVCCGLIQEKAGLSQSTISSYLASLEGCGLLIATRDKQWTYYRRNPETITAYIRYLKETL